ncbi:ABC-type transport auxiliary lipoprotein family protein [Halomonas sp. PAMB 3232]|uniref:PqiC family protein n=1 Tax=Halomonas sp. PAMB 3232 TaxID=3075221 RepID=UPI00289A1FA8|nr:ABC-type transport auxiliary lipoprotein family protein [Halomonas sp. PAMB 3232]WNL37512.1 ABC-type transport auxiliary lipoprotein family protein [Halomonas sp. PAMB 3232]
MRNPTLTFAAIMGLGLFLGGCASSVTPPARYMLPATPIATPATPTERTLQVRAPKLSHYLDVDGIVMQLDDITLNAAREHQWAEELGRQLERGLRARLSQELPLVQVVGAQGRQNDALTLSLEVDQFQGRYDGNAVASGQWQLRGAGNELLALESFNAETELREDGYPALVRALGQSLDQVARDIAREIRTGGYF